MPILEVRADPETLYSVGVQMLVSGDDNRNARVTVEYRLASYGDWLAGPDLFRVEPSAVVGWKVPDPFAGTVFDLSAGGSWEVRLRAVDPDGLDQQETVFAATRRVPMDSAKPRVVAVANTSELSAALSSAATSPARTRARTRQASSAMRFMVASPLTPVRRCFARARSVRLGNRPGRHKGAAPGHRESLAQ